MKKSDIKNYKGFFKVPGLEIMFLKGTSFEDCRKFKPDLTLSEYNAAIGKKEVKKKELKEKQSDKRLKEKFETK